MKKLIIFFSLVFIFSSCSMIYKYDLSKMEDAVEERIKTNDEEQEIHTNIISLKALSYSKLEENEKLAEKDYYLAKMHFIAKWSYLVGERVYNVNDTIDCYFDKDKKIIRIGAPK